MYFIALDDFQNCDKIFPKLLEEHGIFMHLYKYS